MKLAQAVETYLCRRQSLGMKLRMEASLLRSFSRHMGDVGLVAINPGDVRPHIDGQHAGSDTWRRKHRIFRHFFKYWVARGKLKSPPLPPDIPKGPPTFIPYIYSRRELRQLLAATRLSQKAGWCSMDARTFRVMLLFLYGTGMRLGEVLTLEWSDVDLKNGIVTVHRMDPYKKRLLPIGHDVRALLRRFLLSPARRKRPRTQVFLTKNGEAITSKSVEISLRRALKHAGIYKGPERRDGTKYRPRIHDLRHTFAVHRLIAWYREGANVLRCLPALAAYLGHINVTSTHWYLTAMTKELRKQVCYRFDYYASGGDEDVTRSPWVFGSSVSFLINHTMTRPESVPLA